MNMFTKLYTGILNGVSYFYINLIDFLSMASVDDKTSPYFDQFFTKISEDSDTSELTYVKMYVDEDSSDNSY